MTFSIKHELRNGECTALPGRRTSVKGGLEARRIRRHHGERRCHVSLEQRGGRPCVLSMSWGHARGQDNARTVLITIGRILTGHIPTKLRKRLGQGFIPFLDDLFLSNTNCAMENAVHCLDATPV